MGSTPVFAPGVLEGNLAKQRVQRRLLDLVAAQPGMRILDVGCVGPQPLTMWRWVFRERPGAFHLTGVDVAGVERAARVAESEGWAGATRFVATSGYTLEQALGGERFDAIVSTQVLEHVVRIDDFMQQVAAVCRPGTRVLLTLDSAHFRRPRSLRTLAKWAVVRAGRERYHERPLLDTEIEGAFGRAGLSVVERGYHNIHPLKWVHNHGVSAGNRDDLAERWYGVEQLLNADPAFISANKHLFQDLYYELVAQG